MQLSPSRDASRTAARLYRIPLEAAWPTLQALCPPVVDGRLASFEYVAGEVREGRAVVLASSDGILLLALEPGFDGRGPSLIVWCAAAFDGAVALDEYLAAVETWAREMGAARVVMQSPRLGWLRRLPERWRVTSVTYELEVADVQAE